MREELWRSKEKDGRREGVRCLIRVAKDRGRGVMKVRLGRESAWLGSDRCKLIVIVLTG